MSNALLSDTHIDAARVPYRFSYRFLARSLPAIGVVFFATLFFANLFIQLPLLLALIIASIVGLSLALITIRRERKKFENDPYSHASMCLWRLDREA